MKGFTDEKGKFRPTGNNSGLKSNQVLNTDDSSHQGRHKLMAKTSGKMGGMKEGKNFMMHKGKAVTPKEKEQAEMKEKEQAEKQKMLAEQKWNNLSAKDKKDYFTDWGIYGLADPDNEESWIKHNYGHKYFNQLPENFQKAYTKSLRKKK